MSSISCRFAPWGSSLCLNSRCFSMFRVHSILWLRRSWSGNMWLRNSRSRWLCQRSPQGMNLGLRCSRRNILHLRSSQGRCTYKRKVHLLTDHFLYSQVLVINNCLPSSITMSDIWMNKTYQVRVTESAIWLNPIWYLIVLLTNPLIPSQKVNHLNTLKLTWLSYRMVSSIKCQAVGFPPKHEWVRYSFYWFDYILILL